MPLLCLGRHRPQKCQYPSDVSTTPARLLMGWPASNALILRAIWATLSSRNVRADVWGVSVRRRSIVEEANSLGAAVTAAVGLGLADFSAARALSAVTAEFVPDAGRHSVYRTRHGEFVDAYEHLEPWFTRSTR